MIEKIEIGSTRRIDPMMNRRFRLIADKLNEVIDLINGDEAETVSDEPVIETQPVTVDAAEEVDAFDWINCEDKDELEAYGRTAGIELDKRWKLETMKKKLAEHLGVAE